MKRDELELLSRKVMEFSCLRDLDVESFLHDKAIKYESDGLSRTYIYFSTKDTAYRIAAFFSVAITSTDFPDVSKSRKAKILGSKPGRNTKDHFGGILIAQLGRDDSFSSADINAQEIILDAERVIDQGRYYLGGKIVYLDCREPLIALYEKSGYALIKNDEYPSGFFKMFKSLPKII